MKPNEQGPTHCTHSGVLLITRTSFKLTSFHGTHIQYVRHVCCIKLCIIHSWCMGVSHLYVCTCVRIHNSSRYTIGGAICMQYRKTLLCRVPILHQVCCRRITTLSSVLIRYVLYMRRCRCCSNMVRFVHI